MFTVPFLDIKADALDALLAALGFRLGSLIKSRSNDALNALIDDKNVSIQFISPTAERFYEFSQGSFSQSLGKNDKADLTIDFKDSNTGVKLLTKGDIAAFMTAVQNGDVKITGDYKLVLWFAGVAKHATKIPDEYKGYIDQAKPYIAQAKPYAQQVLDIIKSKISK
ncbi:MAG: hypothetical protein Q4B81_07375 [Moraxella sp.]|nr:hypothetical protein [Moraxella sp.]